MATTNLKAFEEKVSAQIKDGKSRLDQLEAKAKEKGAHVETSAINTLRAARQSISQKVQELKTTHESDVASAKADIETDVTNLKTAIDALGAKLKNYS